MVFASLSFIFFMLPLFLLGDFAARLIKSVSVRNAFLLLVSLFFYTWGESTGVFLLLGLGIINYIAGRLIAKSVHAGHRAKLTLAFFILLNLGVLVGFKYSTWLLSFFLPAFAGKKASLPLGISFFTFHAVSYIIDVYRRQIEPARRVLDFLTYFCMFPHLVAGPIVRYAQVQDDLAGRGPGRDLFSFGIYRFLLGLNKKVLIANSVAVMADSAFSMSALGSLGCLDAWLGILAYTMQIYFDFSAYSDMAIGLAAMAGFHFEENFRRPYSSLSIREFWRRWHISLSNWLRDYLYIPLGGSRRGNANTYRNLLIVFFCCGLWHGANMTFVIWGLWHGAFLVLERLPFGRFLERLPRAACRFYAFLTVTVGWVFFRAENMDAAVLYLGDMFRISAAPADLLYYTAPTAMLAVALAFCFLPDKRLPEPTSHKPRAFPFTLFAAQAALAVMSVATLLTGARNPFIYFNF